nr:60 kDa jasmonate-induced protein [Tanacetum cinerariifolium]
MPWYEKKPKQDVVESSSGNARAKDPQGKEKDDAGIKQALEEDMNKKTHFGVRVGCIKGNDCSLELIVDWKLPLFSEETTLAKRSYYSDLTEKQV